MSIKVRITTLGGAELTTNLTDDNTEQDVLNRLAAEGDYIRCVDLKTGQVSVVPTKNIDFWTFL